MYLNRSSPPYPTESADESRLILDAQSIRDTWQTDGADARIG